MSYILCNYQKDELLTQTRNETLMKYFKIKSVIAKLSFLVPQTILNSIL